MELWSTLPPRGCWGRPGKWAPGRAEAPRQPAPAGPGVRGAGRMPGQWREQSFCLPLRRPCPTSLRLGQGGKQGGGAPSPTGAPALPGAWPWSNPSASGPPRDPEGVWWRRDPGKWARAGQAGTAEPPQPGLPGVLPGPRGPASRTVPPRCTGPKGGTPTQSPGLHGAEDREAPLALGCPSTRPLPPLALCLLSQTGSGGARPLWPCTVPAPPGSRHSPSELGAGPRMLAAPRPFGNIRPVDAACSGGPLSAAPPPSVLSAQDPA